MNTILPPKEFPSRFDGRTDLATLWEFCEQNQQPFTGKGRWLDSAICEHFKITTTDGLPIEVINGIPGEDDVIADHIEDYPSIAVTIGGVLIRLTWGEATELATALAATTTVAMFG